MSFPFVMNAQTGTISGKVVDANTGQALMGTSLQVVGTNTGAITDENGEFSIANQKTPINLEITYVGYDKKTLTITNYNPVKISLNEIFNQFDELVVVGYGRQNWPNSKCIRYFEK